MVNLADGKVPSFVNIFMYLSLYVCIKIYVIYWAFILDKQAS